MSFAFQFLDVVVVLIVLVSAVYATYRGLVAESLAVFGWIAAAYATLYLGPYCAGWIRTMMEPRWLGEVVGYIVVFLVVLIPLHFASSRIAVNVKKSEVGTLDSVLGTGFGILRGIAIIGIAYLVYTSMVPLRDQPDWVREARLWPVMRASAEIVASLIPDPDVQADGRGFHNRGEKAAEPTPEKPKKIDDLLQQDQPFKRSLNNTKADLKAGDEASAPEKTQNEAVPQPKPSPASDKQGKHAKKTYGAKDRHALDRLIETSHSDESGKP